MEEELGDEAESKEQLPPPPEWTVPARRSDAVGNLAWQVSGDGSGAADLTALVPLLGALREDGDRETALRIHKNCSRAVVNIQNQLSINPEMDVARFVLGLCQNLEEASPHLFYDAPSCVSVLIRALEAEPVKQEVTSEAKLADGSEIVSVRVGGSYKGQPIRLKDGREGISMTDAFPGELTRLFISGDGE